MRASTATQTGGTEGSPCPEPAARRGSRRARAARWRASRPPRDPCARPGGNSGSDPPPRCRARALFARTIAAGQGTGRSGRGLPPGRCWLRAGHWRAASSFPSLAPVQISHFGQARRQCQPWPDHLFVAENGQPIKEPPRSRHEGLSAAGSISESGHYPLPASPRSPRTSQEKPENQPGTKSGSSTSSGKKPVGNPGFLYLPVWCVPRIQNSALPKFGLTSAERETLQEILLGVSFQTLC